MIRWEIKVGFKEIAAMAIAIPAVYEKIRKLKLKYDIKEERQFGPKEWRKEV